MFKIISTLKAVFSDFRESTLTFQRAGSNLDGLLVDVIAALRENSNRAAATDARLASIEKSLDAIATSTGYLQLSEYHRRKQSGQQIPVSR